MPQSLAAITDVIYVVDNSDRLLGELSVRQLVLAGDDELISRIYSKDFEVLRVADDISDAVDDVIASGESAIAVVDEQGVLLGRLDIVTAYAIRERQREAQLHHAAGLAEEEDLFSDAWQSSKNRGVWLGINLLTAFLASWFIGLFKVTLQEVVALAVLMPVVASMGGVSGSQTLTLIIRGLALGQITDSNRRAILRKELKVGAINGVAWAVVIAAITQLWFDSILLSLTIAIAIVLNLIVAVVSGVCVPSILAKLKIDPALSGAVILTTVTDVVGFVVFLGLGSLLLL